MAEEKKIQEVTPEPTTTKLDSATPVSASPDSASQDSASPDSPENKEEIKSRSLAIKHPDGDCLFYFPENATISLLENAAYRLLSEFIVTRWKEVIIENAKKEESDTSAADTNVADTNVVDKSGNVPEEAA